MAIPDFKKYFKYNPITGTLTWINAQGPRKSFLMEKKEAGSFGHRRSRNVKLHDKSYRIHRVIWAIVHGKWPKDQIDHINGDPSDNRIENLRVVSNRENCSNRYIHRHGHLVGTHLRKDTGKWTSKITIGKKVLNLGCYLTAQEAHLAYKKALDDV